MGIGQFRLLSGNYLHIDTQDYLEQIDEYFVEVVCAIKFIKTVITSFIEAHPYETPTYEIWPINNLDDL